MLRMLETKKNILIKDHELLDAGFLGACDAVAETLGAEGKLAILENPESNLPPIVTKDGVTVMKHIRYSNKFMNFGALQAIGGAMRTLEKSGDSTTTTAVFMQGFIRKLDRSKFNKAVERGIYKGVEEVYSHLESLTRIAEKEDLRRIANIACNNDQELSSTVISAFEYAEKDGIVECRINKDKEKTEFIKREGMFLDSHGYTSPYFINKEDKKTCFEGEKVAVICSATWEYEIKVINRIKEFYTDNPKSTPLIIFLERPHSDMTEKLIGIKSVGYNICCVATNGYDEKESETLLTDIANLTGSSVYNPRNPDSKIEIGYADKITVTLENTSIIVNDIPSIIKETLVTLEGQEKKDERRIKRLKTKAGVIEVGGLTPSQQKEVFDRVEDAVASIKTTSVEGYIVGGGAALVYISGLMKKVLQSSEEQIGYDLVKEVLLEPTKRILKNANREEKCEEVIQAIYPEYGMGYNAVTDKISNLFDDGVIDSKKSIRIAMESATERAVQQLNIGLIVSFPASIEI
jgi:chaperonin GroEL